MSAPVTHLGLCLIDAIQDENFEFVVNLICNKHANPNEYAMQGYTPMHFAAGFENAEFSLRVMELFLAYDGDPNVATVKERFTPLHIAAMNGRKECVRLLIEHDADVYATDAEGNMAVHFAVDKSSDVLMLIRGKIFDDKQKRKSKEMRTPLTHLQAETIDLSKTKNLTPSRIHFNFDRTSPYYIGITHRRKLLSQSPQSAKNSPTTDKIDVFQFTQENIKTFSETLRQSGKFDQIREWQKQLETYKSRKSYLQVLNDIDDHVGDNYADIDSRYVITDDELGESEFFPEESSLTEDSYQTAISRGTYVLESGYPNTNDLPTPPGEIKIKSPLKRKTFTMMQQTEQYWHEDKDNNISFTELKYHPVTTDDDDRNSFVSSSTFTDIPLDYDTDALRSELVRHGERPGPITKSTKRLYVKKLIRYKRNPDYKPKGKCLSRIYSVELEKTFRAIVEGQNCFTDLVKLEIEMVEKFRSTPSKNLREGNRKVSFIYLLLDPRKLNNLAAEHVFLSKLDIWQHFLRAIFYIGKGKTSRPYAHLYEALKLFSNPSPTENDAVEMAQEDLSDVMDMRNDGIKLNRILDIWKSKKGVVCLHVFHNLTPVEAYTREAAMIDAIGLQNLTNLKRGDYYGIVQSWSMRRRKELGVALLGKALHIHLIEGESQIMPTDLV